MRKRYIHTFVVVVVVVVVLVLCHMVLTHDSEFRFILAGLHNYSSIMVLCGIYGIYDGIK